MRTDQELIRELEDLLARYGIRLSQPLQSVDDAVEVAERALQWARSKMTQ